MTLFDAYTRRKIIPAVYNLIKRDVFDKDAKSKGFIFGDLHVLKFNKSIKSLSYPLILIGVMVFFGIIRNFIKHPEHVTYSNFLTLSLLFICFIVLPVWFWFFHKRYKLLYNKEEIIIERFLLKRRRIIVSDIKEVSFVKSEGNLFITDSKGFVRISGNLIGYNDFERFVVEFKEIKRFER